MKHMRYLGNNISKSINNLTFIYNEEGPYSAPVILFIHGFPLNKSMWNPQMEAFKKDFRVIAYDIRGHGKTEPGNKDFSIDLFVNDLIEFMDMFSIDKAILCGLSMGGYIALKAVEDYPKRFSGLVLCDTNCLADTPEAKENRMKAIESIKLNGVEKYADESLKKLFAPDSLLTKEKETVSVRRMILKTTEESLINTLKALSIRQETCTRLNEIKIPVLIMVGSEDTITPPSAAQSMHEKIPGSILEIIEHAGHLSNLENPDSFNTKLRSFLSSIKTQLA